MGVNVLNTVFVNSVNQPPSCFTIISNSLQLRSGQTTLYVKSCWCSLLVLSLILNLVPTFVPVKTNATSSCSGKGLVIWRFTFLNVYSPFFPLQGRIILCCLTFEGSGMIILWFISVVETFFFFGKFFFLFKIIYNTEAYYIN